MANKKEYEVYNALCEFDKELDKIYTKAVDRLVSAGLSSADAEWEVDNAIAGF